MNETHLINSVQQLHDDAYALFNNVVMGTADQIVNDLEAGITLLKNSWEGKDAAVQINNIVDVCNAMITFRNVLGDLAVDASKIASGYREIQNANKANLDALDYLKFDHKGTVEGYTDTRDTVNISPEANTGKQKVDAANNAIEGFVAETKKYMDLIMENWRSGPGRDKAQEAFGEFLNKSGQYKQTLQEVSTSIGTAIQNYTF